MIPPPVRARCSQVPISVRVEALWIRKNRSHVARMCFLLRQGSWELLPRCIMNSHTRLCTHHEHVRALHSRHGHPAGDGLVEDPVEQRSVVWDTEEMPLGVADVVWPPSAHQCVQVGLIDLGADGDDEELDPGVRHLTSTLLQQGLGDGLRPAIGEQHQLPPAS
ncbi:hypothetical protein F7725_011779 [Dissostichus mawsoni]|uniref:Uncharacterized protein n=1 Tax=Dissostichus mawsoni TaxID=36200 RepID=A0A7J5ZE02_DISMA|nr:hypothetical protein F7725_011779 [Dissostichus mawsoni]